MRLHSVPGSDEVGDVTLLAICETVFAAVAVSSVAYYTGSFRYLTYAVCVAPLLLLRTSQSVAVAVRWSRAVADSIINDVRSRFWRAPGFVHAMASLLALLILVPLSLSIVRVAAILVSTFRHPISALRAVPQNWARIALATDSLTAPEIIPGIEHYSEARTLTFRVTMEGVKRVLSRPDHWTDLIVPTFMLAMAIAIFLPSLLYRLALKSTSLIYSPMLFIVDDHGSKSLRIQLAKVLRSPIERYKRWYSGFVLVFLVLTPTTLYFIFFSAWQTIVARVQATFPPLAIRLANVILFTMPEGIELDGWHVARAINAAITIALWLYAREHNVTLTDESSPPSASIDVWLTIRRALTVYILVCTVYLFVTTVDWGAIPSVRVRRWFPWQS